MYMTTDGLKKMAAQNVVALKAGTPLNDSITKVAMDNELNSDQVQRLVEASNQMAYLTELDGHDDRTFEFDVANYDDILDSMIPSAELTKAASDTSTSPMDLVTGSFQSLEKVAQEKEATIEKWGKNQKLQALKKVASQERNRLDEMENAEHDNLVKLAQHRAIISRDPEALEKMAKFDNGLEMTRLVFGHEKVATDVRKVWAPDALQDVKLLSDRLGILKQASEEKAALKTKVEEAEGILKQAFVAAVANAARAAGGKVKAVAGAGAQKAKKAYSAYDNIDSTNEVRKKTNMKYDAWSSLRG